MAFRIDKAKTFQWETRERTCQVLAKDWPEFSSGPETPLSEKTTDSSPLDCSSLSSPRPLTRGFTVHTASSPQSTAVQLSLTLRHWPPSILPLVSSQRHVPISHLGRKTVCAPQQGVLRDHVTVITRHCCNGFIVSGG